MKIISCKNWIIGLLLILVVNKSWSQTTVTNKGVGITNVQSTIYINGSYVHESSSGITNGGVIYIKDNFVNNSNTNVFETDRGKVVFDGNTQQNISGNSAIHFYKLEIKNSSNSIILDNHIRVRDSLLLVNGNINLNGYNIDLDTSGVLIGENNLNRVFGVSGLIKAKRFIATPKLSDNIAGLGLYMSSKEDFDSITVIERGHSIQRFTGDSSILRYYNFIPSSPVMIDSIKFSYLDLETNSGEYLYKVFASANDGLDWKNKGGLVDEFDNTVTSTTVAPPAVGKIRWSLFPTQNFATCLPNDPNYLSAVFLVNTDVLEGDSVLFVQLTNGHTNYAWDFGDGVTNIIELSPLHIYELKDPALSDTFQVTMTVSNGVCSDTRKKDIVVNPKPLVRKADTNLFVGFEYLNLFPNPNTGNFNLEGKATLETRIDLDIADLQGKVLYAKTLSTNVFNEEFHLDYLSPGMYYVRIRVGDTLKVLKMIKL